MPLIDDRELDNLKYSPVCITCKHLKSVELRACAAFEKIPLEIWNGKNKHTRPYKNDNGIQWEQR